MCYFNISIFISAVCEPIRATTCQNEQQVTYTTARFPNGMQHGTQDEAMQHFSDYSSLINSGCHPYSTRFICAMLFPQCEQASSYSLPCQNLCEGKK